jgi:thiosulfate dehydrogenase [quinone] large subunit
MKRDELIFSLLRISLGLVFLWSFLDKLFGLGFSTSSDKSWISGASPTSGFLQFGTSGPFSGIFQSMAGNVIVDWLFMVGMLLIGICLVLGVARKVSAYSGALLMFFMWLAVLPPEHHPFLDEHIIYLFVLVFLAGRKTGLGFSKRWEKLKIVKKYSFLK